METEAKATAFWQRVQKSDGCWEWTGLLDVNGYGRFAPSASWQRKAHRWSWEMEHGPIPAGKVICHHCDNRKCVRPDHLFIGTQKDNLIDASRKGRLPKQQLTHCLNGHEFTPENTYLRPRGGRTCLPCRRAYNSARKKRVRLSASTVYPLGV